MIPQWRVRWVERENAHRAAAYGAYFEAWQREDADLRAAQEAAGDRGADWSPLIAAHQQQRPFPPPKAEPHQAPGTAWWSPARITWASVIGGLLLICICGNLSYHLTN
jgi:hypothetical protein